MGSCCGGSAPQPPNPAQTAAAQTGTNVSTAVANSFLNNVNQITPQGELRYDPTDTYTWNDPSTGASYNIPRWTATQLLSPKQQTISDLRMETQTNLARLGQQQSGMLTDMLGHPMDISGAPQGGDPNALGGFDPQTSFGDVGPQQRTLNQDFSADRQRVEDAMYQRMDPQLQRDKSQLEARLADQGIKIGSPAYQSAMDQYGRQLNDARLGITEKGLAEQQAGFNQALQTGQFYNSAQQQDFQQEALRGQFFNQAQQQGLGYAQAQQGAKDSARQQWLTEQYAQRNQPLNEISSLMSGSQVQQPSFLKNTPTSTIANTDYAGIMNTNFNQNFQNYQQSSQNFNQLMGGIFGAMSGMMRSDRRGKNVGSKLGTVLAAGPDGEKPLPIYEYEYKDDPAATRRIGPMAQDVEKIDKRAVKTRAGTKYIDMTRMGSILRDKVA